MQHLPSVQLELLNYTRSHYSMNTEGCPKESSKSVLLA